MNGIALQAASQFYQLLRVRDPQARARWTQILQLARMGDPQAIRAVRLVGMVKRAAHRGWHRAVVLHPARTEQLRSMLVQARYAPGLVPPQAG